LTLNKKISLYSNCILVKGAERSVICDLQMQSLHYIPNSLYELLDTHLGKTVDEIKKAYDNEYDDIIDEYIAFLEEKECVFYTDTPENFPKLNLEWDYPHKISNAIIDFNKNSNFDIISIINQLNDLRCKNIQLRFFDVIDNNQINLILSHIQSLKSIITSVEIIAKEHDWTSNVNIRELIFKYPRLTGVTIHSSNKDELTSLGNKHIIYTKQVVNSETHCGIISMKYFSINLKTFTESNNYNSCLNRKISIDTNGNIKNCPSMQEDFGHISTTALKDVLEVKEFKTKWGITKDEINVCKDCEFRYVCTDCRAYTENPKDVYSKPLKCGYNPHTNKWDEWSENPLKEKAIEFYGLTEIMR